MEALFIGLFIGGTLGAVSIMFFKLLRPAKIPERSPDLIPDPPPESGTKGVEKPKPPENEGIRAGKAGKVSAPKPPMPPMPQEPRREAPRPPPAPEPPEPVEASPSPPEPRQSRQQRRSLLRSNRPPARTKPDADTIYFKEHVLDQLGNYFALIKRMRKADPAAYDLYSQVGAHILPWAPDDSVLGRPLGDNPVSGWWKQTRPAFGAISYVHPEIDDMERKKREDKRSPIWPRFIYFHKYKRGHTPLGIQYLPNADVYEITVYWYDVENKWKDAPQSFPIAVFDDGSIHAINMFCNDSRVITAKGRKRGARQFTVPGSHWGIPKTFQEWAAQHSEEAGEFLCHVFEHAVGMWEEMQTDMIRIDVRKDALHAVFSVDILQTPYFFADRNESLTASGRRKPIFHIVRPHNRVTGQTVRMHFSGERDFDWNGYHIHITVPGLHHKDLNDFAAGITDEIWLKKGERMLDMREAGSILKKHIAH